MGYSKEWLDKITPPGGRNFEVTVSVDESLRFRDAVCVVDPNVDERVWGIRDFVDVYYPPTKSAMIPEQRVTLVYFSPKTPFAEMKGWADRYGFTPASLRTVLAIGKQHPTLHHDIGVEEMSVLFCEVFGIDTLFFPHQRLQAVLCVLWREDRRRVLLERTDVCWDESTPCIAFVEEGHA